MTGPHPFARLSDHTPPAPAGPAICDLCQDRAAYNIIRQCLFCGILMCPACWPCPCPDCEVF
jgi:hypothetical protein